MIETLTKTHKRKITPGPKRTWDFKRALQLRLIKGLSYADIGKVFGVSEGAIIKGFNGYKEILANPQELTAYQENRGGLLTAIELRLAKELASPEKLEKASLNNTAYAFAQVHTARRLEEGKATENIAYASLSLSLEEIQKRKEALRESLLDKQSSGQVQEDKTG